MRVTLAVSYHICIYFRFNCAWRTWRRVYAKEDVTAYDNSSNDNGDDSTVSLAVRKDQAPAMQRVRVYALRDLV